MKTGRPPAEWPPERRQAIDHPAGFQAVTNIRIDSPHVKEGSVTSAMARSGAIAVRTGVDYLLELQFDGGRRGTTLDFRPTLPLVFST
jgi:hypothetical protein